MTVYEYDCAIADQHRTRLAAEARRERLRSVDPGLRAGLATALRRLADALEPAPAARPRTAA